MTCYMRHLGWLFRELDVDNDPGNRHRLDRAIKHALELPSDTPCSEVWTYLKALSEEERFELVDAVSQEMAE